MRVPVMGRPDCGHPWVYPEYIHWLITGLGYIRWLLDMLDMLGGVGGVQLVWLLILETILSRAKLAA